jgi:hypothetical protein
VLLHAQLALADDPPLLVNSPLDYQIFQRQTRTSGTLHLAGQAAPGTEIQFHLSGKPLEGDLPSDWQPLSRQPDSTDFSADVPVPAGGWYQLEVRALQQSKILATITIPHVGAGEVFVIAGQSNSTNHGSEKQKPSTGMVASFDGKSWAIADDPQPGTQDHSKGGSFLPSFGDAMVARFKVPIAVASTGQGSSSVRQWLPKGELMTNPPTIMKFVESAAPGQWKSTGELFNALTHRLDALGPHGFRAILWHQGESDAGQARAGYPADRQITGPQYTAFMETLIRASRKHAGWEIPWFVAQATYHSEKDPADEEFRAAQKALWESGIAHQGPDTDALDKDYRAGVHFNAKGLHAHGKLWQEKVAPWLERELQQAEKK